MPVSIIIPMLNEEAELPALLDSLGTLGGQPEILFVDGGSRDGSLALVRQAGLPVVDSPPGRALQMNLGARRARGEVLVFLHADSRLPADSLLAIDAAMSDPAVVGGRLDLVYERSEWPYPWIARLGNLRSRLTKIFTGDQTIFVRRSAFDAVGGYPEIPLMEDIEFSRRLRRLGRVACLHAPVAGSTRKWRREGVWRTIGLMWRLRCLYALGASPESLHRLYYGRDPAKQPPSTAG